jgi:pilus assembly protein FimV
MQKKDILKFGLLVAALALSQSVLALGLGKLTVQSALGQALNAQIDLMGTREEFSELTAKIAAPSRYQEKDLVYQAVLTRTKVTLEYRADGSAFLKIVSSQPITEPYIDLLVEVNWPPGHAIREYTVLLDPPAAGQPEPIVPAQQATVAGRTQARAAATPSTAATTSTAAMQQTPRVRPRPKGALASGAASGAGVSAPEDGYAVQRGDTLSGIAKTYKTDEVTLNQALAALYEANPSAFVGKNMNRLRSGAILQVPSNEEMSAMDTREANRVVRVQVAEWRNYIGEVASQPVPVRRGTGTTTAEGTITPQTTIVEGVERDRDQLVVSAGSGARGERGQAAGRASAADLEAVRNAAAEEKLAFEKALTEEKSRVKDLEETVKKLQQAMELKNEQLARMQAQAEQLGRERQAPQPSVAQPPIAPVVEQPPQPPIEPPKPPEVASEEPTPTTEAGATTETPPPPPPPRPQPRPRPAPPPPPPPEPSFLETALETVSENWMLLLGIVGLLAAGGGLMAYRRRRAEEVAVDSLFGVTTTSSTTTTGGTMSPHSSLSSIAGGGAARGSSNATASSNSILSEFSREGLGSIDTGEVDPLAEADVYLAYGRAQQAEEILQDALKRGPDRQDVFLKLLEVYADQKKTTEFEAAAKQLHDLSRGKGEYWQRAVNIGQRLLPGNSLFANTVGLMDSEITSTNIATEPLQVGGKAVDPRGFAPMESKSIAERAADIANRAVEARGIPTQPPPKDFTFGMDTAPAQEDFGVDLDLEELSRFKNYGKAEERVDITTTKQQPDIEFNLDDFDSPPQIDAEKEPARRAPGLAELDFSENDSIAEDMALSVLEGQWHDAATKLDLARAYQATGDAEACREILQEVLQEGDEQQKAEASAILQSLS